MLDEELGVEPGAELAAAHLAVLRADPALGPVAGLAPPVSPAYPAVPAATHAVPPSAPHAAPPGVSHVAPPDAWQAASHAAPPGSWQSATPGASHAAVAGRERPGVPGTRGQAWQRSRQGLRAQLTSFVGRTDELAQLGARLQDCRLVTLIGPGGAGKTRLATEAAEREPGDVCFVPLAPVSDADGVPQAVLAALGIRDAALKLHERPALDPWARLVTALADRELLLVLDNCEHLVAATAELADHLLANCPDLRVLVTSREALGITGESILPVAPLRLPPVETDEPLGYPAVRLFADRAAAVRPGFVVDGDNAAHVVHICRALDGLPLAIELAAARLRTLSVADVAARLDDRFRLLARGSRTALPRHQTLHAVVAWSWDLLDENEQVMARRLSAFVTGARPEVAERVCGLPEEVLFSLAEKSLVEFVDGRFRMLETIRAFCAGRLAESGEEHAVRDAHARCYLDLIMTADPLLRTGAQLEWLARLDEESGDLDAAVRWATASGQFELGLRLLAQSACYWWMRGHRTASASLAAALLAALGETRVPGLEEEYGMCVLVMAWAGGRDELLRTRLEEVRRLLPIDYLPVRVEFMMMLLSMFTGPPADFGAMQQFYMDKVSGLTHWKRALASCGHAFVLQILGRIDEALEHFEAALAGFRAIGERWGMVLVLSGLGALRQLQGDYRSAHALADEALELARELGAATEIAEGLCRRADARFALDDVAGARADYEQAAVLSRRNGSMEILAWSWLGLGLVALRSGEPGAARPLLVRAREVCPDGWYSTEDTRARIDAALARICGAHTGQ
ncbi:tetratricopeptide repeat protein [Nonomuraea sp. PA05]|nr:tetratricopeptide repeat protein [Nonomuraea sp. PA05]